MRLAEGANYVLREIQCGFCQGLCMYTVDQVFVVRVLAEKARAFNTPPYICFVDLKKAYNSVNCETLWIVLQRRCCAF